MLKGVEGGRKKKWPDLENGGKSSHGGAYDPAEEECIVQEFVDNLQEEDDIMQEEDDIVQEFLDNLQDEVAIEEESLDKLPLEVDIVQEFPAHLKDEPAVEEEFLDVLQHKDDVMQGLQCVLPWEEKKEGSFRFGSRGRVLRKSLDAMSVVCSLGGPAAAIKENVFSQALRQLKLQCDFG